MRLMMKHVAQLKLFNAVMKCVINAKWTSMQVLQNFKKHEIAGYMQDEELQLNTEEKKLNALLARWEKAFY